jgi:hypothetical protein
MSLDSRTRKSEKKTIFFCLHIEWEAFIGYIFDGGQRLQRQLLPQKRALLKVLKNN